MEHISVLKKEALELLDIKKDGVYIDGTLGRGGHSKEILKKLDKGHLYCFDLDIEAINSGEKNLKDYRNNLTIINDNFKNMFNYIENVDGILLDLGVSSPQFDDEQRGFSYRFNSKLDMRMDQKQEFSAYELVNTYDLNQLTRIFKEYGEEKFAYKIAKNIIEYRQTKTIETTFELVDIVKNSKPNKVLKTKGHPAKQVFQAIRIEVNKELESLEYFLENFSKHLKKDAKVAIITFHSLEDRMVKRKFQELTKDLDDKRLILKESEIKKADFELVNRKAIVSDEDELKANSRSKSAKLRVIKRK